MSHEHDRGNMSVSMPTPTSSSSVYNHSTNMKQKTMHMTFFWGKDVVVLFQGWPDDRLGMYILALAFVFLLAVAVEVLAVSPPLKPGAQPVSIALIQASVYAVRMALVYLVMLSVMSFNLGIFIVAVAGHALGCFLVKYRALRMASQAEAISDASPKF
ncbi:unnamed protein product [Fraxinus pennsylvanica]|uniref:Copper transport protein n=1 Tax=Fraxinus pennsylvanica TaxID=56036 RepID=A0AAD2A0G5_9LAMI|nr:unnamed protein product [Fraxinus pennsylvanica]